MHSGIPYICSLIPEARVAGPGRPRPDAYISGRLNWITAEVI